ncbi:MAG: hypothetical protein J5732_00840 [Bacteroidaceae bacterium]|nr:hypothetical protein [Bacteroidaceae bacterium]
MSQMPEQVLLHKDEKYNTGAYYSAYDPTHIEIKELDGEDKRSNYVAYIPNYRIKELLNKACRCLKEKHSLSEAEIETFRKELQEDSLADVDWNTWDE